MASPDYISGTAPLVAVSDVRASMTFYQTCLGFDVVRANAAHSYAMLQRGSLMVGLVKAADQAALDATANNVSAQLWMNDVAGYWEDIKGRFADYPALTPTGPIDRDYGVRELHIKDPDGFLMFFTDLIDFTKGA